MGFESEVANEVIFMDDGKIVEMGAPDDVLRNPQQPRTREFMSRLLIAQQPAPPTYTNCNPAH